MSGVSTADKDNYDNNPTDENSQPNIQRASSNIEEFKKSLKKCADANCDENNFIEILNKIFQRATIDELIEMYNYASSKDNDLYEDIAKLLDTTIEFRNDELQTKKLNSSIKTYDKQDERINQGINRELQDIVNAANIRKQHLDKNDKNEIDNANTEFVLKLMKLTENASKTHLINAYQFTLLPNGNVKPGYDDASKILDDMLENADVSRNEIGREIDRPPREFGMPFKRFNTRNTTPINASPRNITYRGGRSYKKSKTRRRRPLKKSRRIKKRKTHSARKTRKYRR